MNLRDLMNKLDVIAEAPAQPAAAPVDAQRAAYDKFRADDAKKAAVDAVKKMTVPNGNSNYIDPKDGVIKYMNNQNGRGGGEGSVKEFPYDWFKKGQEKPFFDQLAAAGLEVIPVERKQLFGTTQVAGVDLAKLATLGQEPVAPAPATADPAQQAQADATSARVNGENIKKLNDLAYKLSQTKGAVPAAKAAAPAAKGVTGGYPSAKEGIEFKSDIAKSLIESFGYEQLDEVTGSQARTLGNAADSIGNAWTGAKNWLGGFGKGVSNPRAANLPNVANGTTANAKGIRAGGAVGSNPGKVAAGSAALGAGAAMLATGNQPATVEVPSVDAQPAVPPAVPPAGGGPTPEQLEIIKQMQEIMKALEGDETPAAVNALSNAQEKISSITGSPAQAAQDATTAQRDRDAADAMTAPATGKPGEDRMAQQASTVSPTAASIISNSPVVQASQGKPGETPMAQAAAAAPVAHDAASLKAAQDRAAGNMAEDAKTNESSDELARWLKIARGR